MNATNTPCPSGRRVQGTASSSSYKLSAPSGRERSSPLRPAHTSHRVPSYSSPPSARATHTASSFTALVPRLLLGCACEHASNTSCRTPFLLRLRQRSKEPLGRLLGRRRPCLPPRAPAPASPPTGPPVCSRLGGPSPRLQPAPSAATPIRRPVSLRGPTTATRLLALGRLQGTLRGGLAAGLALPPSARCATLLALGPLAAPSLYRLRAWVRQHGMYANT